MTDLLARSSSAGTTSGAQRPLTAAAVIAALTAVGIGLGLCMAVAVVGWMLTDAGSHGSTRDALRAGADAWLIGHGSRTVVGGTPLGIVPLGLTAVLVLVGFRCGRVAGREARRSGPVEDRTLGLAAGLAALTGVTAAVAVSVLNTHDNADPTMGSLLLGSLLVTAAGLGSGLAVGSGRAQAWLSRVPLFARVVVEGAITAALAVVGAGALLVTAALLWSFNDASMLMSSMRLGIGDALVVTLVAGLLAPNAVLLGSAWLVGPGFAVGTGTVVSPGEVTLGPLPNFPLLAALPEDGPTFAGLAVLMAVPVLLAAVAAGRAQWSYAVSAWDSSALRGFAVGFGGAVLLTLAISLSGGPMGDGRLSEVGAPVAEVLVVSVGGMSIGGLLGGLAVTAWQRSRDRDGDASRIR